MSAFDLGLGLNDQAWAVLHMLNTYGDSFVVAVDYNKQDDPHNSRLYEQTRAWYNGREQGIVISVRSYYVDCVLHVAFAEHRSSDDIVVYHWKDTGTNNPPTAAEMPEAAWMSKKFFGCGRADATAEYIMTLLRAFAAERKPANGAPRAKKGRKRVA